MPIPTNRPTANAGAGRAEPHENASASRLNWLRAGVLGANDGVVSTASIVVGVAGATTSIAAILTAGVAGLFAGALSMASGEYVSVSSQRDSERALLAQERRELAEDPDGELTELTRLYRDKGLPERLAREVAVHLSARDALAAHAQAELGINPEELTNPWQAAIASFIAFSVGAVFPLLAILLVPASLRIVGTTVVVVLALMLTGSISARLGHAPRLRAVIRNVAGGMVAMGVTYGIGILVGHTVS